VSGHLLGLPAPAFFAILAFVVTRSRQVSWMVAFIFVRFDYYLGGSTVGALPNDVVMDIASMIGSVK
jgi:hypothetical protein